MRLGACSVLFSASLCLAACSSDNKSTTDGGTTADGSADVAAKDGATAKDGPAADTAASSDGAASADSGLTGPAARGEYLVKSVLNCGGCHTTLMADGKTQDPAKFLGGRDCHTKDATTGGCLHSGNLTNDEKGLKNYTDQQIIDAFTQGKDPDEAGKYLFAQMPYYQYTNLSADDAKAIVAFLRTVAPVAQEVAENTAPFDKQPSAPEWSPALAADLPAPVSPADATSAANGKYLASILCVTCHTVDVAGATPKHVDTSKAFAGGKVYTSTVNGASKMIQSANLTPDATGLKGWTLDQITTVLTMGKDEKGNMVCSPMRSYPNMTAQDIKDIAAYLQAMPAMANMLTMTCE